VFKFVRRSAPVEFLVRPLKSLSILDSFIYEILEKATKKGFLLPIFVATDGGQKSDEAKGNNRAVAAAVICMPDIRGMSDEEVRELSVDDLLELELISVITRVSILPEEIGNTKLS